MKIFIVAGGTGGHLFPGLAIAKALVEHHVTFVVRRGDMGSEIIGREGFAIREIYGAGLPRSMALGAFLFPFKFALGLIQAGYLLLRDRPQWIVGMGGYISVPMVLCGRLFGIRTLLHEQNVYPGLANRFLSRFATSVAVSFKESLSYFPKAKAWLSGLPIRSEIGQTDQTTGRRAFGLALEKKTILVFGGSLGARQVNTAAVGAWKLLLEKKEDFQVLHITGKADFDRVHQLYEALAVPAKVLPFCHDMASAYAASDMVISRAGASTVSELMITKRWAILIPYPYATNDHQTHNAKACVDAGMGEMITEKDLSSEKLAEALSNPHNYVQNKAISEMGSGAAARLARYLTSHSA